MQLSESTTNILFALVIVVMLAASFYTRKRKNDTSPLGMVVGIFLEVTKNLKRVENFEFRWKAGKLKSSRWNKNKGRLDFLPAEIHSSLSVAFDMVEEVNQRIDSAQKYKSDSYMAGIDVSKLKVPLTKSKEQLQLWLKENLQNPAYQPKRRGLFG